MTMDDGLVGLIFLFIAGFCATAPWRVLGVMLSQSIDADSEILRWVRAVSTALIAGLVARLVFVPAGVLADVPLWVRLAAFAAGLAVYFASRRNLAAGIVAGEAALLLVMGLT